MNIKDFFALYPEFKDSTLRAFPVDFPQSESDYKRLLMGDYEGMQFPVLLKHEKGKYLKDFLEMNYIFLISEKCKQILEQNNLTGWKIFPIKILDKRGAEIPGYFGLSVTGKCGPISYNQCEIIEKRLVPQGPVGKYYRGLYVGLDTWDGADFFLPEGNLGIIVTKKAADLFLANKLTNVVLKNLNDIETPEFSLKIRKKI